LQEAEFDQVENVMAEAAAPPPSLRLQGPAPSEEEDDKRDALRESGERPVLPGTMVRLRVARARIYEAARNGQRIRTYEVALDLDMSEFHFARQFRLAFDRSPHVFYDEVRADSARALLAAGMGEGVVARRIGFRRPAELRALLLKRPAGTLPADLDGEV
jgi:AraC-like DNA-binding protein